MTRFQTITELPIPTSSQPMLDRTRREYGFIPNIVEGMARSPELLRSYQQLSASFDRSSLTPEERQIVLLTVSRFNECEYCTSVHSLAAEFTDLEWETIERIRNRQALHNPRYEALRRFTERVVVRRGMVAPDEWTEFTDAGFTPSNVLDVVLGVTLKTLTNTANHLIDTPLDAKFERRAWSVEKASVASV